MPPAPEVRKPEGKIRLPEVLDQLESKQPCDPCRDAGIAGKVAVKLHGIKQRRHQHGKTVPVRIHAKKMIHQNRRPVRNYQLHEKAQQDTGQPPHKAAVIKQLPPFFRQGRFQLGQEMPRPFDRAAGKIGEKGNKGRVFPRMPDRPAPSGGRIQKVACRLQRVKRNAYGRSQIPSSRHVQAHPRQPAAQRFIDQVFPHREIAENHKQGKIAQQAEAHKQAFRPFPRYFFRQQGAAPGGKNGKKQPDSRRCVRPQEKNGVCRQQNPKPQTGRRCVIKAQRDPYKTEKRI